MIHKATRIYSFFVWLCVASWIIFALKYGLNLATVRLAIHLCRPFLCNMHPLMGKKSLFTPIHAKI